MAGETIVTVVGNLTADPELRVTQSGDALCNFNVASTPRTFDRKANEWRDGETTFFRCTMWREAAEHAAESLSKGVRVVVTGRFKSRTWEDKDTGQQRTSIEVDVDEVGPSLRYATAKVTKATRDGGQRQPPASSSGWGAQGGDPWSSSGQSSGGWGGGDEVPF